MAHKTLEVASTQRSTLRAFLECTETHRPPNPATDIERRAYKPPSETLPLGRFIQLSAKQAILVLVQTAEAGHIRRELTF